MIVLTNDFKELKNNIGLFGIIKYFEKRGCFDKHYKYYNYMGYLNRDYLILTLNKND